VMPTSGTHVRPTMGERARVRALEGGCRRPLGGLDYPVPRGFGRTGAGSHRRSGESEAEKPPERHRDCHHFDALGVPVGSGDMSAFHE
jgi:hypothetical protein